MVVNWNVQVFDISSASKAMILTFCCFKTWNIAFIKNDLCWLANVSCVNNWGWIIFQNFSLPVNRPYFSTKRPRSSRFCFCINEYHAFSHWTTMFLYPQRTDGNCKSAHLSCLYLLHRDTLAMDSVNIDFRETTFYVRAHEQFLANLNLPSQNHSRKDQPSIFDKGFSYMKFRRIILAPRPLPAAWINW